jgi:glycosyltransferase involved in cell wall biosynthesis
MDLLEACLASIGRSEFADFEILIAQDGMPDACAVDSLAARYHARVAHLDINRGPATARNFAACAAKGEILVFLDADATVHRDTLARIAEDFRDNPHLDALVGSYDFLCDNRGTIALFRNLLHAHVHHRSAGPVTTFWAGCGAVRRACYEALHGFRESYRRPSIEDVEFGARLSEAGGTIRLDPAIQVTHLKEWTVGSMVYADIFLRAVPWTELILRHGLPANLNFRWQDRASVFAVSTLLPALAVGAAWHHWWFAVAPAAAIALLQAPLFRFFVQQRGIRFAVCCYPLYLLHSGCALAGLCIGIIRTLTLDGPARRWAHALLRRMVSLP